MKKDCRKCVHYDICTEHHKVSHDWDARICHFFTDKSKVIELKIPYNTKVYVPIPEENFIWNGLLDKYIVWEKQTLIYLKNYDGVFHSGNQFDYMSLCIEDENKIWFTDKSKAESKLKELNNEQK